MDKSAWSGSKAAELLRVPGNFANLATLLTQRCLKKVTQTTMAKYFVKVQQQQFCVTVQQGHVIGFERLNAEGEVEEAMDLENDAENDAENDEMGQLQHLRHDRFQWQQQARRQNLTIIPKAEHGLEVHWRGQAPIECEVIDEMTRALEGESKQQGGRFIHSQMPGVVLELSVKAGDPVKSGDVLLILEAMKTENEICSERDGLVKAVHVEAGQIIADQTLLVELADLPEEETTEFNE